MSLKLELKARSGVRQYGYVDLEGLVEGKTVRVWMRSLMADERQRVRRMFLNDDGDDTRPDAGEARQAAMWCESIVTGQGSNELEFDSRSEEDLALLLHLPSRDHDALSHLLGDLSYLSEAETTKNVGPIPAPGP